MSAYSTPRQGQLVSFHQPTPSSSLAGMTGASAPVPAPPAVTSLPQIAYELEAFISSARSIEGALHHERALSHQLREQIAELQSKLVRLTNESERRNKEALERENLLKGQLQEAGEKERSLNERINAMAPQLERLREELDRLRVEKFEDRKKNELELELAKASVEHLKQREDNWRTTLSSHQSNETALNQQLLEQKKEAERIKTELLRYKAAWGEVLNIDRKAKQALSELENYRKRNGDTDELLAMERRRRDELEGSLKKEKRDKQIALNCLQSAEIKMEQLSHELELLRDEREKRRSAAAASSLDEAGSIHLKF